MNKDNIILEFDNSEVGEKLNSLLEDTPKEHVRALIMAYYNFRAQAYINDKNYEELKTLEGVIELYNLLG